MTSVEQKQQTPLPNRLSVDTKAKAPETQQAPKSASTAGSNLPNDLKDRAVARAQEYLYASPGRHSHVHLTSSPHARLASPPHVLASPPHVHLTSSPHARLASPPHVHLTSSPHVHHHHHAAPVAHGVSAGYVQYQPPSYEVVETHTAHREKEVTVEVPKYKTYVHYQPEAYEIEETHTAQREKEVTVEVPKYKTYVHYQPETYEVEETHHAQREKEVTVEIPKYTTYHTYKPEAYEITETHTAMREKEVTVEVPVYKEVTYCSPERREVVQDYIPPKEHIVHNAVQTVSYRLVTNFKAHGQVVNSGPVTIVNNPHEFHSMVKSASVHASPVKKSVPVNVIRPVEVVEVERCNACGQNLPGNCQHCGQKRVASVKKSKAPTNQDDDDDVNQSPKKVGKRRTILDDRTKGKK